MGCFSVSQVWNCYENFHNKNCGTLFEFSYIQNTTNAKIFDRIILEKYLLYKDSFKS